MLRYPDLSQWYLPASEAADDTAQLACPASFVLWNIPRSSGGQIPKYEEQTETKSSKIILVELGNFEYHFKLPARCYGERPLRFTILLHFVQVIISGDASKASVQLSFTFKYCITLFWPCLGSIIKGSGRVGSAGRSTRTQITFQASQSKYFVQCFMQVIHTFSVLSFRAFPLISYPKLPWAPSTLG